MTAMYYLRQQTKVSGPFTAQQLRGMLQRGRAARSDKVSTDRQNWVAVGDCADIVALPAVAPTQIAAESPVPAPPADGFSWHYTVHGAQQDAPVDTGALQNLVAGGTVGPEELVWRDGFLDWVTVRDVAELASALAAAQSSAMQAFNFGAPKRGP